MSVRLAVTGTQGQVARALMEIGPELGLTILPLGRPDIDLTRPDGILPALRALAPDAVVSAAAFTEVDRAEDEPELAHAINAAGAGAVAEAAKALGVPVVHLSTDYVFAGDKMSPYIESDPTGPTGVYGESKLAGEALVRAANPNHVIARTAWVYSPFGKNFVKTMLRVAADRPVLRVVDDQRGNPTSAHDIARGLIDLAHLLRERPDDETLRGTVHLVARGEASWADFAEEIFRLSAELNGPHAQVERIPSTAYPTRALRPANSRLDTSRLETVHGIVLPEWRLSLEPVIRRILNETQG